MKRILHEQELARLEEASKKVETNEARMSERKIREEMQRRQRELEKLAQEEDWEFDCAVCGVHGKNMVPSPWRRRNDSMLTFLRTTGLTALHARSAMSGNTALAMASRRKKLSKTTSTSSAPTASAEHERRMSRRSRL